MKVHPFTMLVPDDKCVVTERISVDYFYHFLHRHDEWQLTWVEEGNGTLIAGNNMLDFSTGDVYLIGANLPHLFKCNAEYFEKDSQKSVKACSIYFNPKGLVKPLFSLPELQGVNVFLEQNPNGFKIPEQYAQGVKDAMLAMHYAEGSEVIANFLRLLQQLMMDEKKIAPICSAVYSSTMPENEGVRLGKIIGYIIDNYQSQITLEDVANAAYMTPQAFCRYFKKHTRHTFISFLNEVRINDACKTLTAEKNNRSMVDVAYNAGFNSITNFNRVFKTVTGKSPKAYMEAFHNVSKVDI